MSTELAIGGDTVQSTIVPWPYTTGDHWFYPNTYVYPSITYVPPAEEYANEVEVEQNEHDAILRFYRTRGEHSRTLVKEVTVPLGVLEWLQAKH